MGVGSCGRGINWTALEKWSMMVKITVLPWEGGSPVTKSTAICDQRRLGVGRGSRCPAGGELEALERAQVVQAAIYLQMSFSMEGQKTSLEETYSPMDPSLAGYPGSITPGDYDIPKRVRHKQSSRRTLYMVRCLTLGLLALSFNVPGQAAHKTGCRDDGRLCGRFSGVVFPGECIWLDVTAPGAIGDGKVKPIEKQTQRA